MTVLSTVNGIVTENGEVPPGQHVILGVGQSAQFGPYSLTVVSASAGPHGTRSEHQESDQFHVLGRGQSPESIFDNMFFQPRPKDSEPSLPDISYRSGNLDFGGASAALRPQASRHTTSAGMQGGGARSSAFSPLDPISVFDNSVPDHVAPARSIDEFLGNPSGGTSSLGASMLLKAILEAPVRKLAVDHVHDFNLPLRPPILQSTDALQGLQPQPGADASSTSEQIVPSSASPPIVVDPWEDIQANWLSPSRNDHLIEAKHEIAEGLPVPEKPHATALDGDPFNDAWSEAPIWSNSTASDVRSGELANAIEPSHAVGKTNSSRISASEATVDSIAAVPGMAPIAAQCNEAAMAAFCRGLGVDSPNHLDDSSWEQMGSAIRVIVGGLTELMGVRAEVKRELRAPDRTMLASHNNNPLKSGMSLDEILQYVLFNPTGVGGYMPVNKALDEAINEMRAHELASVAAARGAVEGSIQEFSPETLRAALLKNKAKLPSFLNNARLWDMYVQHYEQRSQHMADWLEQIFNCYFMPVYSRESERFRNNASTFASR